MINLNGYTIGIIPYNSTHAQSSASLSPPPNGASTAGMAAAATAAGGGSHRGGLSTPFSNRLNSNFPRTRGQYDQVNMMETYDLTMARRHNATSSTQPIMLQSSSSSTMMMGGGGGRYPHTHMYALQPHTRWGRLKQRWRHVNVLNIVLCMVFIVSIIVVMHRLLGYA